MSLKSMVGKLLLDHEEVAWRPAQVYSHDVAGGIYTIFTINNGPVLITALGGFVTAAAVDAVEVDITINTVHTDAASVAINGAIGTIVLSTLNVGGTLVNAAAAPMTVVLLHPQGFISGTQTAAGAITPGLIVATFTVGHWTGQWFCIYRRLSPNAVIT